MLDGLVDETSDHASIKVRPDGATTDRHLYPLEDARWERAPAERLLEIGAALGADADHLRRWCPHAAEAETVLVGWDAGPERTRLKLYLVRDEGFAALDDPDLVHLACRWEPGSARVDATRYERPRAEASVAEAIAIAFGARWVDPARALGRTPIVRASTGDRNTQRLLISRDPEGGRQGFDILVRRAGANVAGCLEELDEVIEALGMTEATATDDVHRLADRAVQRLAGGSDHDGAPFLTLYLAPPPPPESHRTR